MAKITTNCPGGGQGGSKFQETFDFSTCDRLEIVYGAIDASLVSVDHEFDLDDEDVAIAGSFRKGKKWTGGVENFTFAFKDSATISKFRAMLVEKYKMLAAGNANAWGQFLNGGLNVTRSRTYPNGAFEKVHYNNLSFNPKNIQGLGEDNTTEWEIESSVPVQGFVVESVGSGTELPTIYLDLYKYSISITDVAVVNGKVDLSKAVISDTPYNGEKLFPFYDVVKYNLDGTTEYIAVGVEDLSAQTAVPVAKGEYIVVFGKAAASATYQVIMIEG